MTSVNSVDAIAYHYQYSVNIGVRGQCFWGRCSFARKKEGVGYSTAVPTPEGPRAGWVLGKGQLAPAHQLGVLGM